MRQTAPIVLASAADAHYLPSLAVMVESALSHLGPGRTIDLHLIDGGITGADKQRLHQTVQADQLTVHWHRPARAALVGLPLWGRIGISVYDKLLVPDVLPQDAHRALWLDADTMVLDDLGSLWDHGTGTHALLAVRDRLVPCVSSRFGVAGHRALGLRHDAPYFNSGVMLIDLERWRRTRIAARALEYVRTHADQVTFWDQEGLNAVLAGEWGELDAEWNWSLSPTAIWPRRDDRGASSTTRPRIVHFSGNLKPWVYGGRHPSYALYYQHLDRTAWRGSRPARRWPSAVMRAYEHTSLRRLVYPAEQLGTRLVMSLTRRRASTKEALGIG